MAVTVSNYRITPFSQKDGLAKFIFGGVWGIEIVLPTPHGEGDGYILAVDFERIVYPLEHPVCAWSTQFVYTAGQAPTLEMEVSLQSTRLAQWVSTLKKPTPIYVQIARERDGSYETLLLDEILALPSVIDGDAYADSNTPLQEALDGKLDAPTNEGEVGDVLAKTANGDAWAPIGVLRQQVQSDWEESDSDDVAYIRNKPQDFNPRQATDTEIDARESTSHVITPNNLDYAVRSVSPNVTEIPAATSAYTLLDSSATTNNHSHTYRHAPSTAPTYTLPAVTDTAISHLIILTVDFATVQTLSFVDANGDPLTMQYTPTIAVNDVYTFRCEYSAVQSKWLIYPVREGGATTNDFVLKSEVGAANGVAGLNSNGTLPQSAFRRNTNYGVDINNNGIAVLSNNSDSLLAQRSSDSTAKRAITNAYLNKAVTAALTDSNKISLTAAQKASAQDTLGAYGTLHLDAAPTTCTVGAFGQRAIVDSTGKAYTCTAVTVDETDPQNPVTTYTWTEDLPVAGDNNKKGVVGFMAVFGIKDRGGNYAGCPQLYEANNTGIDTRQVIGSYNYGAITPNNIVYAVRSVLPNITEIPAATSAYTLIAQDATTNNHCYCYEHAPESAPTYTLPAVTGNAVKREIVLTVRFSSSVLTYAFEDSAGNAITPLPLAGTIADGSVVCFRCTWEALLGNWVIMPVMLGTYEEAEP